MEDKIINLFKRGLREGEEIVDNSSPQIAKELNTTVKKVDSVISKYLKNKYILLNKRINLIK